MDNGPLISKIAAAVAIISIIFAPVAGCGSTNFSGLDIVLSKDVSSEVKLFLIISVVCGILIFVLEKHSQLTVSAIAGGAALIIAYLIVHSKNGAIELRVGSFIALIGYAVSGTINFMQMQKSSGIADGVSPPSPNPSKILANISKSIEENETIRRVSEVDIGDWLKQQKILINDFLKTNIPRVGELLKKNIKTVIIVVSSIIILYGGYYFFLKPDPVKDALNVAAAYCECQERYNDGMLNMNQKFIKEFDTYGFKTRREARNRLNELQNAANTENDKCTSAAQEKYYDSRNRYLDDQEMLSSFDLAYNSQSGSCYPSNQSKLSSLYSEVENKITSIKDPEPDIEKIKTDLIGQKIPGWNFDYLNEFKSAEIINVTRGNDRVEYQIKFHLRDEAKNSEHDCEVLSVYLQGDQGWYFNNVHMFYITYENQIPSDQWIRITPLQNCTMSVADNQKLFWRTENSTSEIKSGPDAPNMILPNSNSYLIRSREGYPVTVKFTYRSNNEGDINEKK